MVSGRDRELSPGPLARARLEVQGRGRGFRLWCGSGAGQVRRLLEGVSNTRFSPTVNPCCYYPCQNQGVCVRFGLDNYQCDCTRTGYSGPNCTIREPDLQPLSLPLPGIFSVPQHLPSLATASSPPSHARELFSWSTPPPWWFFTLAAPCPVLGSGCSYRVLPIDSCLVLLLSSWGAQALPEGMDSVAPIIPAAEIWTWLRNSLRPSPSFTHFLLTHGYWFWELVNTTFIREVLMRLVITGGCGAAPSDMGNLAFDRSSG